MPVVNMSQLLEAGVHFGHQSNRWNPKMSTYILTKRNGIHIINLLKTVDQINLVYEEIRQLIAKGGDILFVGTKSQAREAIEMQATRVGMPYVNQRWLGGMLTNFETVSKRVKRLQELEQMDFDVPGAQGKTKKEMLLLERELTKLKTVLGGFQTMRKPPQALWVVDILKEKIAVDEARRLNIKVFSILDTNCNPDIIYRGIPGNDDATSSIDLLTEIIADAVAQGLLDRSAKIKPSQTQIEEQPLAQWEKDLLTVQQVQVQSVVRLPAKEIRVGASETAVESELGTVPKKIPAALIRKSDGIKKPPKADTENNDDDKSIEQTAGMDKNNVQGKIIDTEKPQIEKPQIEKLQTEKNLSVSESVEKTESTEKTDADNETQKKLVDTDSDNDQDEITDIDKSGPDNKPVEKPANNTKNVADGKKTVKKSAETKKTAVGKKPAAKTSTKIEKKEA
ncbi:MAG: 30S ribosomal protein S2 [Bifidobacteriaceae bacterium]|jgi:small subunit ribosomal protein S2|nr:30S ribosomal protein S2 [Bifidobacteriaceae bacterium]